MTRPIKSLWLLLLGVLGLYGGAASAATVGVLCSSELQGESEYPSAPGCVDVLAWSWGLSAVPAPVGGGGSGAANPSFQDISLTKNIDTSSEDLFRFVATQVAIKGIVKYQEYFDCGSACSPGEPYLTIHMKGVKVSSQSMGGSGGAGRGTENVSLSFEQISYCYTAAVKGSGSQCFAFDKIRNTPTSPF